MTATHAALLAYKDKSLTFTDYDDSGTDSSSFSIASLDIGAAANNRLVIAIIHWFSTGATSLSSATIGGITATIHIQSTTTTTNHVAIISALVPTGTTATVAGTMSGTCTRFAVGVWRAINLDSYTPTDTDQSSSTTNDTKSVTVDVPRNGFALAGGTSGNGTGKTTTGLTERYDNNIAGEGDEAVAGDYSATVAESRLLQFTDIRAIAAACWN